MLTRSAVLVPMIVSSGRLRDLLDWSLKYFCVRRKVIHTADNFARCAW